MRMGESEHQGRSLRAWAVREVASGEGRWSIWGHRFRREGKAELGHLPTATIFSFEGPLRGPNRAGLADSKGHRKGQFKLGTGRYCYPLTVQDAYSRYLLACEGLEGPLLAPTQQVFRRLFRTYGLPQRIRSDHDQPFASCALGRLSQLSVWWLRLGIRPELIEPASPRQNGRHERMHRDLKAETTRPAAASLGAQQRRFDVFRRTFNEVRPHEALRQRRPAGL
jgi:transposase InsO family protein